MSPALAGALIYDFPSPMSEVWVHFEIDATGSSTSAVDNPPILLGHSGTPLFRLLPTNAVYAMEYWNGSTWVALSGTNTKTSDVLTRHDIHIVMENSAGVIEWYVDDTLIASYYADTIWTAATQLNYFQLQSNLASGFFTVFSQIILADESTIGCKVFTHQITADGAVTQFTGSFADYNMNARSIPRVDTMLYTTTDGAVETGVVENLLTTSLYIRGVQVTALGRRSGGSLSKLNAVLRSSAANYFSDDATLGYGNTRASKLWTTDPATGVDWTTSGVNAMEVGVRVRS